MNAYFTLSNHVHNNVFLANKKLVTGRRPAAGACRFYQKPTLIYAKIALHHLPSGVPYLFVGKITPLRAQQKSASNAMRKFTRGWSVLVSRPKLASYTATEMFPTCHIMFVW